MLRVFDNFCSTYEYYSVKKSDINSESESEINSSLESEINSNKRLYTIALHLIKN